MDQHVTSSRWVAVALYTRRLSTALDKMAGLAPPKSGQRNNFRAAVGATREADFGVDCATGFVCRRSRPDKKRHDNEGAESILPEIQEMFFLSYRNSKGRVSKRLVEQYVDSFVPLVAISPQELESERVLRHIIEEPAKLILD